MSAFVPGFSGYFNLPYENGKVNIVVKHHVSSHFCGLLLSSKIFFISLFLD